MTVGEHVHTGNGLCPECCRQIASPKYRMMSVLSDLAYPIKGFLDDATDEIGAVLTRMIGKEPAAQHEEDNPEFSPLLRPAQKRLPQTRFPEMADAADAYDNDVVDHTTWVDGQPTLEAVHDQRGVLTTPLPQAHIYTEQVQSGAHQQSGPVQLSPLEKPSSSSFDPMLEPERHVEQIQDFSPHMPEGAVLHVESASHEAVVQPVMQSVTPQVDHAQAQEQEHGLSMGEPLRNIGPHGDGARSDRQLAHESNVDLNSHVAARTEEKPSIAAAIDAEVMKVTTTVPAQRAAERVAEIDAMPGQAAVYTEDFEEEEEITPPIVDWVAQMEQGLGNNTKLGSPTEMIEEKPVQTTKEVKKLPPAKTAANSKSAATVNSAVTKQSGVALNSIATSQSALASNSIVNSQSALTANPVINSQSVVAAKSGVKEAQRLRNERLAQFAKLDDVGTIAAAITEANSLATNPHVAQVKHAIEEVRTPTKDWAEHAKTTYRKIRRSQEIDAKQLEEVLMRGKVVEKKAVSMTTTALMGLQLEARVANAITDDTELALAPADEDDEPKRPPRDWMAVIAAAQKKKPSELLAKQDIPADIVEAVEEMRAHPESVDVVVGDTAPAEPEIVAIPPHHAAPAAPQTQPTVYVQQNPYIGHVQPEAYAQQIEVEPAPASYEHIRSWREEAGDLPAVVDQPLPQAVGTTRNYGVHNHDGRTVCEACMSQLAGAHKNANWEEAKENVLAAGRGIFGVAKVLGTGVFGAAMIAASFLPTPVRPQSMEEAVAEEEYQRNKKRKKNEAEDEAKEQWEEDHEKRQARDIKEHKAWKDSQDALWRAKDLLKHKSERAAEDEFWKAWNQRGNETDAEKKAWEDARKDWEKEKAMRHARERADDDSWRQNQAKHHMELDRAQDDWRKARDAAWQMEKDARDRQRDLDRDRY